MTECWEPNNQEYAESYAVGTKTRILPSKRRGSKSSFSFQSLVRQFRSLSGREKLEREEADEDKKKTKEKWERINSPFEQIQALDIYARRVAAICLASG